MSKAKDLMRQMFGESPSDSMKPVRTTRFETRDDGSVIRSIHDKDGNLLASTTITKEQRLALDARAKLSLSQHQFATLLGISARTLHDWEQGRRKPSGAAVTLLKVAALHPGAVRDAMQML